MRLVVGCGVRFCGGVARDALWQLTAAELRAAAVEASAEILRLEAVRVAVVDELSFRSDDQVIASRGVGAWLAANTMLQVRDGKKIAALGAALRPFPAVAAPVRWRGLLVRSCCVDRGVL